MGIREAVDEIVSEASKDGVDLAALFHIREALLTGEQEFSLTCNGLPIPMVGALWERIWDVVNDEIEGEILLWMSRVVTRPSPSSTKEG